MRRVRHLWLVKPYKYITEKRDVWKSPGINCLYFCSVCVLAGQCSSYVKTEKLSQNNVVQSHCEVAMQEIAGVITQQVYISMNIYYSS